MLGRATWGGMLGLAAGLGTCTSMAQQEAPRVVPSSIASPAEALRTRCIQLFNEKTYKGHVVNGHPLWARGGDLWYTFTTDGSLAATAEGKQVCRVRAQARMYNQDVRTVPFVFDGATLEWRNSKDPDSDWVRFTPLPDGTLLRTGEFRNSSGIIYSKPVRGTNVYHSGTTVFTLER